MKACTKCKASKPIDAFPRSKRSNGRIYVGSWCRSCATKAESDRRRSKGAQVKTIFECTDSEKECRHCRIVKPFTNFSPSVRGVAGKAAYCKPCVIELQRTRHAKSTTDSRRKYRATPKWKAAHRLHQFNRKSAIKAQSDGTVTQDFLIRLYGEAECAYCLQDVMEKYRTADHKTPLSRGGLHSAMNMVMACHPCNSTKGSMTEAEFLEKIRDNN